MSQNFPTCSYIARSPPQCAVARVRVICVVFARASPLFRHHVRAIGWQIRALIDVVRWPSLWCETTSNTQHGTTCAFDDRMVVLSQAGVRPDLCSQFLPLLVLLLMLFLLLPPPLPSGSLFLTVDDCCAIGVCCIVAI